MSIQVSKMKTLLFVSTVFPPMINPLANRVYKLLVQFQKSWQILALTRVENAYLNEESSVHFVKHWYPQKLIDLMSKLKLEKILRLLIWPDQDIFWVLPALIKGYQLIQQQKPDAIFVFMMPYSASFIGIGLKWLTGLPLVFSLDDSITCTDMHPESQSLLHYHLKQWLEKFYVRQADALVYVSQFNLEQVKKRQPLSQQSKFHLIRCGADPLDFSTPLPPSIDKKPFEIVYIGGMNGWYDFYYRLEKQSVLKKLYKAWIRLGIYEQVKIDHRSSSPVFVAKAIQQVIAQNPNWEKEIQLVIHGNPVPKHIVQTVLENQKQTDVVSVFGSVSHHQALQLARSGDLLLITLPNRPDGSSGGRISCKTYEYLMTDRPILAAVPKGENWDYLKDKPGVWLVEPTDTEAMSRVISEVVSAHFSNSPLRFDRTALQQELSYVNLAEDYLKILDQVCLNNTKEIQAKQLATS
ncbi:hypothetical protein DP113_27720 [Brasilonema octagenarum UFV-E1]|uniref:Glycosyltransferase subfamily 4-like N-terminal domain-containing protein n=1 Tax=Brasilonema sennae CENA114 TaxID=415709 RepID=A0A856MIK5_9CYAN|nr:glycosyltransferase [Brasilonema sennae]QDL11185.1 hypothetical protein DP114_27790 [Brasilonema sennae CENA114]QDL17530.1 hypothetical protein DP113_27720 [Brasilonema octagenarum UFV-E1]